MNGFSLCKCWTTLVCLLVLTAFVPALFARDVFVMLSGGVSPFDNNYSQYLQARAMTDFLENNYPPDSVWIFFGAGNVKGEKPILADVCQESVRDGLVLPSWLPGSLPHNLPARRSIVLAALRDEILPAITNGGTLFLFVGDHGSRTRGRNSESEIDLWSLGRDAASEHGWRESDHETLPVSELRSTLVAGIGQGRVVFCMTQCHAGGFHYLAIPHEMAPNPHWFTDVPLWATSIPKPPAFPNAAGFTATDEFSLAAGCDPDPDPTRWAGYERFVPENLLGMDLFTLKAKGRPLHSFAEAHAAATLQDSTVDKPASTSDQFLERWANLIDTRLATEPNLTPKVRAAVTAYQRSMNGAPPKVSDPAFKERQAQFNRFIARLSGIDTDLKELLLTGPRKQLEETAGLTRDESLTPRVRGTNGPPGQPRRRGQFGGRRRLWRETVRPVWQAAIEANQITNLSPATIEFEKHLLSLEDDGENFFFGGGNHLLEEEVFWESGFANPQTVNFAKADNITRWGAERRIKILAWAKTNSAPEIRDAAERLERMPNRRGESATNAPASDEHAHMHDLPGMDMETAAARALFYRRVLAAWEFLIAVDERPALDRLRDLIELEHTPLPTPAKASTL